MSAERFERLKKFLTGPWTHDGFGNFILDVDGHPIAEVRGWGSLTGIGGHQLPEDAAIEVQKARGDLLAAAPDLYVALEQAETALDALTESEGDEKARASAWRKGFDALMTATNALKKARGEA